MFKRLFDIVASLCGLLLIWWIFPIVAFLIHKKMPGGPAFFCQKRVGKDGKLFTCHKFPLNDGEAQWVVCFGGWR